MVQIAYMITKISVCFLCFSTFSFVSSLAIMPSGEGEPLSSRSSISPWYYDFSDHHNTGSRSFCQFCTRFLACLVAWFISSIMMFICADQKSEQYSILLYWFILLGISGYYVPQSNPIVMEDFISHNICCLYSSAEECNSRVQQALIILVMRQVAHMNFKARKSLQLSAHLQYCSARGIWKLKKKKKKPRYPE